MRFGKFGAKNKYIYKIGLLIMPISHNHHYIPQMYLSNWAVDNKLFVYRLLVSHEKDPLWSQQSVVHTASLNKLYVDIQDSQESDQLEHLFDMNYESPAKESFDKIINGTKMSSGDWVKISNYIVLQYIRTPSFYFYITDIGKTIIPEIIENSVKELESVHIRHLKNTSISAIDQFPDAIPLPFGIQLIEKKEDDKFNLLEIQAVVGKQLWLYAMLCCIRNKSPILALFRNLKWSIVTVSDHIFMPSCDNPVVLCEIKGEKIIRIPPSYGVAGKNKAVIFPVSPTIVLLGTYSRKYAWRFQADECMTEMLRKAIIDNSLMFIYSSYEDYSIPGIKPRLIDSQEYKRYNQQFDTWFEKYRVEEGPLLTRTHSLSEATINNM